MPYRELTPQDALERLQSAEVVVILDVRTVREWVAGHIPGAVHIPLHELAGRYQELDPEAETLVICQHGVRSEAACQWLAHTGFDDLANVRYGMSRWPGPVELGDGSTVYNA